MRNVLLLATLLFCAPITILKAKILYVGADEQYKTISAVMWDVSPGDTIIVRDGVYDKSINIISPLTLKAEHRHKAIIGDGIGTEGVFKLRCSNVIIDGFKFMDNPDWPGIALGGLDSSKMAMNCKIINNEIINRKNGIRFSTFTKNCLVDNNIITGSTEDGIIHAGESHTISNNRIEGSGACGIQVFEISMGPISIMGNTIRLSVSHGIEIRSSGITLKNNTISENTEAGVVTLSHLKNITLSDSNRIENNGLTGIFIESNTNATIKDNIISGNEMQGIEIAPSGTGSITGNIIRENEFYGILNMGSAIITANTISENRIHGVENRPESSRTLLVNNTISNNTENGVQLFRRADFSGNTISGNGFSGIFMESIPDTVTITQNNKIISNSEHGIFIPPKVTAIIGSNIISENGTKGTEAEDYSGIVIEGTATVEENYIENNFYCGISITASAKNVIIRHNRAINGNGTGIRMEGPARSFRNSIKNNMKQGILVATPDSCEIIEDTISGNSTGILIGRSSTGITSIYNCEIINNIRGINSHGETIIRRSSIVNNSEIGVLVKEAGIDLGHETPEDGGYNTIRNNLLWDLVNETPDTVIACLNYWTYTDSVKIDSSIYDFEEDSLIGPVIFSPFLAKDITGIDQRISGPSNINKPEVLEIFPNPSRDYVNIKYQLETPGRVTLTIVDLMGRIVSTLIRNEYHEAGPYAIKWDPQTGTGTNIKSGIYLIILTTDLYNSSGIIQLVR